MHTSFYAPSQSFCVSHTGFDYGLEELRLRKRITCCAMPTGHRSTARAHRLSSKKSDALLEEYGKEDHNKHAEERRERLGQGISFFFFCGRRFSRRAAVARNSENEISGKLPSQSQWEHCESTRSPTTDTSVMLVPPVWQ